MTEPRNPPMSEAQFALFSGMISGQLIGIDMSRNEILTKTGSVPMLPVFEGMVALKWVAFCNACEDPHPTPAGLRVYADALEKETRESGIPQTDKDPRVVIDLFTGQGQFVAQVRVLPFLTQPDAVIWGERLFVAHHSTEEKVKPLRPQYREAFTAVAV